MIKFNVLGVCRFSMIGRGDWKLFRKADESQLEALYDEQAAKLFEPRRMEHRLATLEHLTLRSMAAQTDQNFHFLIVTSDRMPQVYLDRLKDICFKHDRVSLYIEPPCHISDIVRKHIGKLNWAFENTVQFRLDDDDALAKQYIRTLRKYAGMFDNQSHFAFSSATSMYAVTDGPTKGIYEWYQPFFAAGCATKHPRKTVFEFAHFAIPRRMPAITDVSVPNLVTHYGDNDTPRHEKAILKKRGMVKMTSLEVKTQLEKHFDLTPDGLHFTGLSELLCI